MNQYRTNHKSALRVLSRIAYERELKVTLSILAAKFDKWKMGKVTSFEMEELVHKFDCDESRKLWSLYNTACLEPIVARAVAIGLLSEEEVGISTMKKITEQIGSFKNENYKNNSASIKNKKSAA